MTVEQYWSDFKKTCEDISGTHGNYYFCNNEKDAKELAQLVYEGKKRATASNFWIYQHENELLPQAGDLNVITDFHGEPVCIVKTVCVDVVPFREVTPEFAAAEGEGDLSLEFWREVHKNVFIRECESIGKEFSEELPVVCERFEVVFR